MTRPSKKKLAKTKKSKKAVPAKPANEDLDQLRRGMPAPDSVRAVEEFVSPQGVKYTILKTTEMDAYDPAPRSRSKRKTD